MKELENLTRIFYVLSNKGLILTDDIWNKTPLNNLEKLSEGMVEFKKDPKKWTYGYDQNVGRIVVPKTIGEKLIGSVPEEAKYYFVDENEEEIISKTKSQVKITYYKIKE